MIELDSAIVGIWYISLTQESDWLAALSEVRPGEFKMAHRFRYYADYDPFSENDMKRWYGGTLHCSRNHAISTVQEILLELEKKTGRCGHELLMKNGDVDAFMRELSAQPWAHTKMIQDKPEG